MIYSFQSPESIARDVEQLNLAAVVADREDWTAPVVDAAKRTGSAGVAISLREPTVELVEGLERTDAIGQRPSRDSAFYILTSGTTGPPKRQAIDAAVLEHTVFSVTGGQATPDDPPELMYWPLGGIGGVCQLVTGAYVGKQMVLLEKFSVDEWVRAVKTYGIKRSGVQPAVVRRLLDANLPTDDLASLDFIMSAAGPLDPEVGTHSKNDTAYRCYWLMEQRNSPTRCAHGHLISTGSGVRRNAPAPGGCFPIPRSESSTRTPAPRWRRMSRVSWRPRSR